MESWGGGAPGAREIIRLGSSIARLGEEGEGEQEDHLVWVDRIAGVRGGKLGWKGRGARRSLVWVDGIAGASGRELGRKVKGSKKITWSGLTG